MSAPRLLAAAARRRAQAPPPYPVDAFRLINGPGDGAPPGLTIDHYRDATAAPPRGWRLVSARVGCDPAEVAAWAAAAAEGVDGVALAWLAKAREDSGLAWVHGAPPPGPVTVREGEARLTVRLGEGPHSGLFLDHRDSRRWVYEQASGAEVLNLFSYTCAFSVQAALGGATRVTSVDASRRALRWGRDNMAQSGVDPDAHRWFCEDALGHLNKGPARRYDLVVADPPLFGRAGRRRFSLLNTLDELFTGCLRVLRPGGRLLFSTHALALSQEDLLARAQTAAQGRPLRRLWSAGLPAWDHPTAPEHPGDRGAYLKTLVLELGTPP